jgi:diadenosine tetraphosphate (Ap4A) HIT family hydrolase
VEPSQEVSSSTRCPFCDTDNDRIIFESKLVRGVWDGYPVSHGHALLVPKRHIATWFEADAAEQAALLAGVACVRKVIESQYKPDGYNIGVNSGPAAGQTVGHLHLHVIPRYEGDVADPRGGIRWVIPGKADYWSGEK